MKIEKVNISELVSPAYNPRDITPEEMEKLKRSIIEFGYVDPIIVNEVNNHIIGGNQRYEALKSLGYDEVDVVYVHEEDQNREKALNIALNKISGEWDFDKLDDIFMSMELDGFDISLTGFDDFENAISDFKNEIEEYNKEVEERDYSDYDLRAGKVVYEPKETNHKVEDLYHTDFGEIEELINKIENEDLKKFFNIRKIFFTKFNFDKIADYYAYQANEDEKKVFEKLGLVLLDYEQLIENGFTDFINTYLNDDLFN